MSIVSKSLYTSSFGLTIGLHTYIKLMIERPDEDAEKVTELYHLISRKIFVAFEFPKYK